MGKKAKTPSSDKSDSVITPGGPRPKDQVHPVKPGEVLRRNADGSFTIVHAEKPSKE
jgi:hypothetical protein